MRPNTNIRTNARTRVCKPSTVSLQIQSDNVFSFELIHCEAGEIHLAKTVQKEFTQFMCIRPASIRRTATRNSNNRFNASLFGLTLHTREKRQGHSCQQNWSSSVFHLLLWWANQRVEYTVSFHSRKLRFVRRLVGTR